MNFRAQHRARNHESAHASALAQALEPADTSERPLVHPGAPEIVETAEQLQQLIVNLRDDGSFAYDSEFIGELTYHPRLCLLQVASHRRVALIDPLAELDLLPFWELLADPAIEKIVHAGEQDIEPVVRHLRRPAANVLDTQICAGFIGLPYPLSLSKLVAELTGARLGKGLTFTHWDNRPLSPVQLRYAADDVRYLPAAAAELLRRMDALRHTAWAREECAAVCSPDLYRFDPQTQFMRVRGATSLQPRNLAILRELTILRDSAAREQDVPPRSFLKDEVLLDLARNPAKSLDYLGRVRGLPRAVEHDYGRRIIDATSKAFTLPTIDLPAPREYEPSPRDKFRVDAVFSVAQCLCAGLSMDPALVASRQDVTDFYRSLTTGPAPGETPKLLQGWRKQAIGDPLIEFLDGKRNIELNWIEGALRATR
ncbi:MAG TPA: HRDC domain-containing protein [Tepidisphaeraceae bacterium]|jgi:ribonuclease D|nr:HRDC domain-containing protein [Tepidisphaeraceae bacterium]